MWRHWIYALRARLRALVRRERSDRELNDELSFHLAMETQANVALGMSESEAARRARLDLGGVQQLKEHLHEQRSVPWFDHLRQDVRLRDQDDPPHEGRQSRGHRDVRTWNRREHRDLLPDQQRAAVAASVRRPGSNRDASSRCGPTPARRTPFRRHRIFVTGASRVRASSTSRITPVERSGSL